MMGMVDVESQSQRGPLRRQPSTGSSNKRVTKKKVLNLATFWLLVTLARAASVGIRPTEQESIYPRIMACKGGCISQGSPEKQNH